jgi:uncharacterized protein (TIGR00251 family)
MAPRPPEKITEDRSIRLAIKVVPGSSRSGISGWLGDTLKIRVTAVAERGKANAAVAAVLADALSLPGDSVRIVSGHTAQRKTVEIDGLSEEDVRARLARHTC